MPRLGSIALAASLLLATTTRVLANGSHLSEPADQTAKLIPPAQQIPLPFTLTPQQAADVDRLLARWEAWNAGLKTFDCQFKRWTYDIVFGPPGQAKYIDVGTIKYAAPNRLLLRVDRTEKDGREIPIDDNRAEHWVFNGKSVFNFDPDRERLLEYRLPTEIAERQLVDGPLSFGFVIAIFNQWLHGGPTCRYPFAATADQLKRDYYIREVPCVNPPGMVSLEAYPRTRHIANCLSKLALIFNANDMSPFALKIVQPNDRDYTVYQFFNAAANAPVPQDAEDPFQPEPPPGWTKLVEGQPALLSIPPPKDNKPEADQKQPPAPTSCGCLQVPAPSSLKPRILLHFRHLAYLANAPSQVQYTTRKDYCTCDRVEFRNPLPKHTLSLTSTTYPSETSQTALHSPRVALRRHSTLRP